MISILTTTYNRVNFLYRVYKSLADQSYKDWEWIVINDGSSDETNLYLNSLKDPRIKLYSLEHLGRVKAIAIATEMANRPWIGILDDDDWLDPECLENCLLFAESNQADFIYTNCWEVNKNEIKLGKRSLIPYSFNGMLLDLITFHFRFFKNSKLIEAGGIDTQYQTAFDYDLCLRLTEVCKVAHLKKALYFYQIHSDSISYSKRADQIYWSFKAVQNAIKRRGLENQLVIDLEARFKLYEKVS